MFSFMPYCHVLITSKMGESRTRWKRLTYSIRHAVLIVLSRGKTITLIYNITSKFEHLILNLKFKTVKTYWIHLKK